MVASESILDCKVESALVLKVASLSILVCKVVSALVLAGDSASILLCKVESALVLLVVSVVKSVLNKSVVDVNELLIATILLALLAISVSN